MKKRISELDALRCIAAVSIVLFHINVTYPIFKPRLFQDCLKFGATGVDLFFIISGFVILLTLEKTKTWKDFVIRRCARLYPSYWICVTLTTASLVIYWACTHQPYLPTLRQYLPNMTMFQHYFNVPNIDDVYWTLIIEMLFYLFMLLLFSIKQLKNVEYIAVIVMLPLFIYSSKYFQAHCPVLHPQLLIALPLINEFPLFVLGILYYRIHTGKPTIYRYTAIVVCMLCQVMLYGNGLNVDLFLSFKDYVLITLFYNLVFLLYINGKLKFIVNRVTLFFGDISYPLYLIHYYLSVYVIIPALISIGLPQLAAIGVAIVIVILLAILIARFIEKPAMRYFKNRFTRKDSTPPQSEFKTV
jgi:peptidoglycan/LPS O-acetylase OafA/YrhL